VEQKNNIHDTKKLLTELDKLHVSMEVPYEKGRDKIWDAMQQKMATKEIRIHRIQPARRRLWLVAATLAILMGVGALLRFYHRTIRTAPGQMVTLTLPDGSTAALNAQSVLTYYPLWWSISAKVTLTGEAFFKGHHSQRFSVKSDRGTVAVLGTSFDIYARRDNYRVVCFTGKVRVTSRTKNRIVLTPGDKAVVNPRGEITFSKEIKTRDYNAWTNHQFVFTAVPLASVLNELARRYNVKIDLRKHIQAKYTGNFSAEIPVEQALNIVCKPFGLTFVKTDSRHFVIQ
jgi:ferric-dicitrate binding protein FerR (iron transport regulator)